MNVDDGKFNSAVFLDIKNAVDNVEHKILLDKLLWYGIKDNSQKRIESYLQGRIQCCSVNDHLSTMEHVALFLETCFHQDMS